MVSRTFRTKAQAADWARKQETEIDSGAWRDTTAAHKTTLADLLDLYEVQVLSRGRSEAVAKYHLARFREDLGHLRLTAMTPGVLAAWRDERLQTVKPATVARELSTLGGIFSWAIKDLMIALPENPVGAIRRPSTGRSRDRRLYPDEERLLLEALTTRSAVVRGPQREGRYQVGPKNPWLKPAVKLALETAMRQGELVALTWGNVDLERRTATLEMTKNGDARVVPLSTAAIKVLQEIRPDNPDRSAPVLPTSQGSLKQAWGRAIQQARRQYVQAALARGEDPPLPLFEDLTFHDLRHEATSRLAERLPNLIELASVTGHRDLRMLQRYYHPRASDLAQKLG